MGREIELKFRCEDLAAVRERLRGVGATPAGRVFEVNHILDTADRRLQGTDCGLRLREVRPLEAAGAEDRSVGGASSVDVPVAATLTYKGPREAGDGTDAAAGFKAREEIETPLGEPAVVRALLARLGYRPVIVYEKWRETWRHGACTVELDELPRLGTWVEIEGPDEASVTEVRAALGLAVAAPVADTYVALAAREGTVTADGMQALRFGVSA